MKNRGLNCRQGFMSLNYLSLTTKNLCVCVVKILPKKKNFSIPVLGNRKKILLSNQVLWKKKYKSRVLYALIAACWPVWIKCQFVSRWAVSFEQLGINCFSPVSLQSSYWANIKDFTLYFFLLDFLNPDIWNRFSEHKLTFLNFTDNATLR